MMYYVSDLTKRFDDVCNIVAVFSSKENAERFVKNSQGLLKKKAQRYYEETIGNCSSYNQRRVAYSYMDKIHTMGYSADFEVFLWNPSLIYDLTNMKMIGKKGSAVYFVLSKYQHEILGVFWKKEDAESFLKENKNIEVDGWQYHYGIPYEIKEFVIQ